MSWHKQKKRERTNERRTFLKQVEIILSEVEWEKKTFYSNQLAVVWWGQANQKPGRR